MIIAKRIVDGDLDKLILKILRKAIILEYELYRVVTSMYYAYKDRM